MAEYIERETAVCIALGAAALGNTAFSDRFEIAARLRATPAADVRPVVLCKDCKYWKQWDNTTHYLCTYVAGAKLIRNADDFCSRGEKGES